MRMRIRQMHLVPRYRILSIFAGFSKSSISSVADLQWSCRYDAVSQVQQAAYSGPGVFSPELAIGAFCYLGGPHGGCNPHYSGDFSSTISSSSICSVPGAGGLHGFSRSCRHSGPFSRMSLSSTTDSAAPISRPVPPCRSTLPPDAGKRPRAGFF